MKVNWGNFWVAVLVGAAGGASSVAWDIPTWTMLLLAVPVSMALTSVFGDVVEWRRRD